MVAEKPHNVRRSILPGIVHTDAGQNAQLHEADALSVSAIMSPPFGPRRPLSNVQAHTAPNANVSAVALGC